VDVVENPISVWEAIKAPFHRLGNLISSKIEQFAASKAKEAEESAAKGLNEVNLAPPPTSAPAGAPPAAKPGTSPGMMMGVVAGGGLAMAALGSAAAYIVSVVSQKGFLYNLFTAVLTIVVLIGLFAAILGWLKLRLRDLGPLLEANGWAVNIRMRVSGHLSRRFTRIPALPRDRQLKRLENVGALLAEDSEEFQWKRVLWTSLICAALLCGWLLYRHIETLRQERDEALKQLLVGPPLPASLRPIPPAPDAEAPAPVAEAPVP